MKEVSQNPDWRVEPRVYAEIPENEVSGGNIGCVVVYTCLLQIQRRVSEVCSLLPPPANVQQYVA